MLLVVKFRFITNTVSCARPFNMADSDKLICILKEINRLDLLDLFQANNITVSNVLQLEKEDIKDLCQGRIGDVCDVQRIQRIINNDSFNKIVNDLQNQGNLQDVLLSEEIFGEIQVSDVNGIFPLNYKIVESSNKGSAAGNEVIRSDVQPDTTKQGETVPTISQEKQGDTIEDSNNEEKQGEATESSNNKEKQTETRESSNNEEKQTETTESSNNEEDDLSINFKNKGNIHPVDIKEVLKGDYQGRILLKYYEKNQCLDEEYQLVKLCKILVGYCFLNGIPVVNDTLAVLKEKLKVLFPNIDADDLYLPPSCEVKVRSQKLPQAEEEKKKVEGQKFSYGKLVNAMRNVRTELREAGLIAKGNKREAENSLTNAAKRPVSEDYEWLERNSRPWSEVERRWMLTFEERKKDLFGELTSTGFLDKWSHFKTEEGHKLVELDFGQLYPGKEKLIQKWDNFMVKKLEAIKKRTKDPKYKEILDLIDETTSDDERDYYLLRNLPALMNSKCMHRYNKGKSLWKPTLIECSDSMIQHVTIPGQVQNACRTRIEKMKIKELLCQPFIIIVGQELDSISAVHVFFNDILYCVDTVKKGIDLCFKCFMTTNTSYPKESEWCWQFLQHYIWGISSQYDKPGSMAKNLIKYLQKAEQTA